MGTGNSRLRSRVNRGHRSRRLLLPSFICGGGGSSARAAAALEMEDNPVESLVNSAERCDQVINEVHNLVDKSTLISHPGVRCSSSDTETGASSQSYTTSSDGNCSEVDLGNSETSNWEKCLSESKELLAPCQVSDEYSPNEPYQNSSTEASTSFNRQQSSDTVSVNLFANNDSANGIDNSENMGVSHICPEVLHPSSSSPQRLKNLHSENHLSEITAMRDSVSDSVPYTSEVPITSRSPGDESIQEAIPAGVGFLESNTERESGDGSVVHVDVLSISSSIFSGSNTDSASREARRSSRRVFWDAFSRRSSRRHVDSPDIFFSTDNSDDLISHDHWLLDFSHDIFDDRIGSDSGYLGSRIHTSSEQRQHSGTEIWERLRSGLNDGHQTAFCPSGLHPDGSCSCESFLANEEYGTHASISRIVMLAEALFEVLDEIHRQPLSLSLSMVSLPAPELVVDSFPLKNHKKVNKVEDANDVDQCYICLAEYEEGDKIRVLPCRHEYHMTCVDKWLKEIHGVCPLCRGDVRQGTSEPSEIPAI